MKCVYGDTANFQLYQLSSRRKYITKKNQVCTKKERKKKSDDPKFLNLNTPVGHIQKCYNPCSSIIVG